MGRLESCRRRRREGRMWKHISDTGPAANVNGRCSENEIKINLTHWGRRWIILQKQKKNRNANTHTYTPKSRFPISGWHPLIPLLALPMKKRGFNLPAQEEVEEGSEVSHLLSDWVLFLSGFAFFFFFYWQWKILLRLLLFCHSFCCFPFRAFFLVWF